MNAPAAYVFESDLLDVNVHRVAGYLATIVFGGLRVSAPFGSRKRPSSDTQAHQPSADGGDGDDVPVGLEFVGDAVGRPFLVACAPFRSCDQLWGEGGGLVVWDAGSVEQAGFADGAVPVHPLRQALAGDARLCGELRDGAVC
ncbi:hypothetical protein M2275_008205 [Rhodococcus opacus]|nr:hypothetical protein [Rhodococcus opacus]